MSLIYGTAELGADFSKQGPVGDLRRSLEDATPSFGLPPDYRQAVLDRLTVEDGMDPQTASVAVGNAALFLHGVAAHPDVTLSPSETVDRAWHQMILHTSDYARYCLRAAGHFIHHQPTPKDGPAPGAKDPLETFRFLQERGYEPDERVWLNGFDGEEGNCHGSGCAGTCTGQGRFF